MNRRAFLCSLFAAPLIRIWRRPKRPYRIGNVIWIPAGTYNGVTILQLIEGV